MLKNNKTGKVLLKEVFRPRHRPRDKKEADGTWADE